jgi:hypothetical protein
MPTSAKDTIPRAITTSTRVNAVGYNALFIEEKFCGSIAVYVAL